ncbi:MULTISPECIES: hypothetical protein [Pseudomonas]|uniref:Uncharacterized protein n=1 Tax=Serpens gallinarum TaxID=2763075 RepID=A0ABR8TPS1_9PSED|nr:MULTISPECIES: hypothetical protein [Pseudomonas]MBD7977768.1 hypothetical protein [Serpens gallinarum]MBF0674908.1 hypothetical protein [Pseudomonas sp.]
MESMYWMLLLLFVGFLLLGFGFNYRNHNGGIGLMGLGIISVLSTVLYKLHLILN